MAPSQHNQKHDSEDDDENGKSQIVFANDMGLNEEDKMKLLKTSLF